MDKFPQKLGKIIIARVAPSSLQFRLTVGVILSLMLGIGSLTLWISWELKQLSIAFNEDMRLWAAIQQLKKVSILSFATTATFTTWFIWRSLLPWRQIADISTSELKPYSFQLTKMPKEIKNLARNWNRILDKLAETREKQQQLIDDLAHELRTPLSLVYGYLQRTQQRSENLTDSQKEALDMAVEEAERMVQLLQKWLNLTRSDNIIIPWSMESLLLNDLLAEVTEMTAKFKHREIQLHLPHFPVSVRANRDQIAQILSHLLENALQYSEEREPIIVRLTQAEDWAVIAVSDRGCGIPLSQQSRIFDPFYRVDPSRNRGKGGAGLGLSLVKRLVEGMGGEIAVQSQPGEGSTFILKLPILGAKL
jgi:signal transduction histidine kinase